jgi:hypothetical protein
VSESIPKRSFGKLRPVANRTNQKSPTLIGKLTMQQSTLDQLAKEMRQSNRTEIECNVAGWYNADHIGKCNGVGPGPEDQHWFDTASGDTPTFPGDFDLPLAQ